MFSDLASPQQDGNSSSNACILSGEESHVFGSDWSSCLSEACTGSYMMLQIGVDLGHMAHLRLCVFSCERTVWPENVCM